MLLLAVGCAEGERAPWPAGVAASAEEAKPLGVGARAPEVELRDVDGRAVALGGLREAGTIALVFYRGGW